MHIKESPIPIIDIFAGPGGLGEGFTSFEHNNANPFKICLSIEKDESAYNTLRLRSFFRNFKKGEAPEEYYNLEYDRKRRNFTFHELYEKYQDISDRVNEEVLMRELGKDSGVIEEIDRYIGEGLKRQSHNHWVLIGGPPCQAYSTAGRSRNKGKQDYKPEEDHRHFLYKEYLRIISRHWPSIFVMENVKGILTSRINGDLIFNRILSDLKEPASSIGIAAPPVKSYRYKIYSFIQDPICYDRNGFPIYRKPSDFIIESEKYGIPQARHRVILLGIREDINGGTREILKLNKKKYTVNDTIKGLPILRSGLSRETNDCDNWQKRLLEMIFTDWFVSESKNERYEDVFDVIYKTIEPLLDSSPDMSQGGEDITFHADSKIYKSWFLDKKLKKIFNSTTKSHLVDDLYRYFFSSCFAIARDTSPRLIEFPTSLLPKHKSVQKALETKHGNFADRFRVQLGNKPSTTIMSHISKDGHYYIHPDPYQCRSLTVREAARLQTFPDNYIFTGARTSQYTQVGNAVPPLLARQLGEIVHKILRGN